MNQFEFDCPHCGHHHSLDSEKLGVGRTPGDIRIRCSGCDRPLWIGDGPVRRYGEVGRLP